jgi:CheY-like chemotaxis protein/HPt (histidine-containing phosphotransfer) domain-containing protein
LLINLVGNAIKFTKQGSVVVVACVETSGHLPLLTIEVRDTGIGIPEEKLEAIFKPFMQADNSITRNYGGTGLGLTISRKIAEALGGSLHATSQLGVGSVFTARLAMGDLTNVVMLAQPGDSPRGDIVDDAPAAADLEGLRVLVVDDGETNRRLVGLVLERVGAKVKMADNGKVAVQLVRDLPFDVVLMDMQMPVLDGYAATRQLRQNGFHGPVIALTAHAMKGDRDKCEAAGCDGYLTKPIDTKKLLRTVANHATKSGRVEPAGALSNSCWQHEDGEEEIRSMLPTDDPELCEIVQEFVDTLGEKVTKMEQACENDNRPTLAELAHWLKGAGGTVGFACFTEPAQALERLANEREPSTAEIRSIIRRIRSLTKRIVLEPVG